MKVTDLNGEELTQISDDYDFESPSEYVYVELSHTRGNFSNGVNLAPFEETVEAIRDDIYSLFDHLDVADRSKAIAQWRKAVYSTSFNGGQYSTCLMGQVGIALETDADSLNQYGLLIDYTKPREAIIRDATNDGDHNDTPLTNLGMYIVDAIMSEYQDVLEERRKIDEPEEGVEVRVKCEHCGDYNDRDDAYEDDDDYYCNEDCFLRETGSLCDNCDEYKATDDGCTDDTSTFICEDCHGDYSHCTQCENLVRDEAAITKVVDGDTLYFCDKECKSEWKANR